MKAQVRKKNEKEVAAVSHRGQAHERRREVRRALAEKSAAAAIGLIEHGCDIFVLTAGQFDLIDAIIHVLSATGRADVVLATWTAAAADIKFAYKILEEGRIRSIRFLVDFSFVSRQPAYCAALRETFGEDCIRITKLHAKFVLVRNASWDVVIKTSMNLNQNRRMETIEVSEDKEFANFMQAFVDEVFGAQPVVGQFEKRPMDHMQDFERLVNPGAEVNEETVLQSTDAKRFYSEGPFGNDLRRTGITYLGGRK